MRWIQEANSICDGCGNFAPVKAIPWNGHWCKKCFNILKENNKDIFEKLGAGRDVLETFDFKLTEEQLKFKKIKETE